MFNLKNHAKLALAYFLFAAVLGTVLRFYISVKIPADYRYIVHAHSHIALLGWVYMALTTLLYMLYLNKQGRDKEYRILFWFTQFTLVGMLLSFPFQGYALFSIIFSTLFLFASYWFTWFFINNVPASYKNTCSYRCVKFALWYMVLSSLGPWVLGGVTATLGPESVWYRLAIYFYLHFQYNGWMILALLGILFYTLEENNVQIPKRSFKHFFWSMNLGAVLTFFLSTLWTKPSEVLFILGAMGAVLQIMAFVILLKAFSKSRIMLSDVFSPFQKSILLTTTIILAMKMTLQLLSAIPYFSNLAATITDFVIGYLHWTFLGVTTLGLFLFLEYYKLLQLPKKVYFVYILGFIATEGLIFYKGIMAWQKAPLLEGYFEILALASMAVPLSLLFMLAINLRPLR